MRHTMLAAVIVSLGVASYSSASTTSLVNEYRAGTANIAINSRFTNTHESLGSTVEYGALTSINGKTSPDAVTTRTTTRTASESVILGQRNTRRRNGTPRNHHDWRCQGTVRFAGAAGQLQDRSFACRAYGTHPAAPAPIL
jgi:hypothetical protein